MDLTAPHMMAVTVSTEVAADDEVLTSELLTATALMKRQARIGVGFFQRILPVSPETHTHSETPC